MPDGVILSPAQTPPMPSVTVVIPCHNYGQWVGDAMRSVADQDYPNKKIVVVDDGSTDRSWETIQLVAGLKVPQIDPQKLDASQIELIKKRNVAYTGKVGDTQVMAYRFEQAGGPSRARNLGIKLAWNFTHVFGFLDADDIYYSGKLSKSVAKIMEDPTRIGAVYTDYETVRPDGLRTREYKEPFSRERLLRECMVHSSCVVSKLALQKCGLYDESLRVCEDYDLWCRITEHFLILHIPECLMSVRVGSHNSTATVKSEIWNKCWSRVAEKVRERSNPRT